MRHLGLVLLILLACAGFAFAQTPTDTVTTHTELDAIAAQQGDSTAAVTLLGQTLFYVPAISVVGANARARDMSDAIHRVARNLRLDVDNLRAVRDDRVQATLIMCQNEFIGSVWDYEAAAAGVTTDRLVNERLSIIREAIVRYRNDLQPRAIVRGAIFAALTTLGVIVLLIVVSRLLGRLEVFLEGRLGGRTMFRVLTGDSLKSIVATTFRFLHFLFIIWVVLAALNFILSLFPWTYGIAATVFNMAARPIKVFLNALVAQIPSLFSLAFVIIATKFALRGIHFFFREIERKRIRIRGFYEEWAKPTYNIVRIVVIAFAFVFAFPYIPGSNSAAFKGVSIFVGVLVSLGSGSAVANIISGVILTYMRPFSLGDRVQIGDTVGDVIDRTLLVTRIRTTKNERVTIPNNNILNSHIRNYTAKSKVSELILHTSVSIGYDVPWRTVHELLINAATETDNVLEEPAPFVLQKELGDFYVEYELNVFTDQPRQIPRTYSALHEKIQDKFNEAGVEILSPHYRAHRQGGEPAGATTDNSATEPDGRKT